MASFLPPVSGYGTVKNIYHGAQDGDFTRLTENDTSRNTDTMSMFVSTAVLPEEDNTAI
jgi:hypothetical protein